MALRGLVEGDCGGQNPLNKLRGHFTQDQGLEGLHSAGYQNPALRSTEDGALVTEFLHETHQVTSARPPTTFRMDSLLKELSHKDGVAGPQQADPVASIVTGASWAGQYSQGHQDVLDWSHDFLRENDLSGPDPLDLQSMNKAGVGWAEDYLSAIPLVQDSFAIQDDIDPVEYEGFVATLDNQNTYQKQGVDESLDWADEFITQAKSDLSANTIPQSQAYNQDFWSNLETEWEGLKEEEDHPWLQDFRSSYEPFNEYAFQDENPAAANSNALEEGKQKLKEGDLPSAVILFESAVKQDPESVEGWFLLGKSQAENEQDPQAIAALKKCVELEPGKLEALMGLAVSLTNESYQAQACQALELWIQNSGEYSGLVSGEANVKKITFSSSFMSNEMHEKTTNLYIEAARMKQGSDLDPDIQAGLGILFNLSGEYDKAIDCFQAAVSAKPSDSLLWNRLGATLANGDRSEEAVSAYHTALRYSPGFIRCRYNLGISCINLKAYSSAAEHFLTALNFQATGRGPKGEQTASAMSDSVWSSLRLALSLLNRSDLKELADRRDLANLSREFNINIQP